MYAPNNDNVIGFATATGKMPPQNIEAEEAILGGILLDPAAIARVKSILKPHHFYLQAHSRIYDAALKLHLQEKPTDLLMVINYLKDNDLLELIGGRNKLASLVDRTVSAANIDHLAELVVEKWKRRELGRIGTLAEELQFDTQVPLDEALKKLQDAISNLHQEGNSGVGATHIAEAMITLHDYINEVSKGNVLPGIPSGFYDLDTMISGGFNRGDLVVIAARPAMGKSAFATQIGLNIATSHKLPVILFSLEMSKFQIALRSLASEVGIESGFIKTGRISDGQWDAVNRGINTLTEMPFYMDDNPVADPSYIEAQCRRVMASQNTTQLGLIIVDYLQLMDGEGAGNRNNEISKLTRSLKRLAMKLNTPVMCLSQLSRAVEARTNKRPMLSDLRDSGAIEQDADKAIMLYRDEYYTPDTPDRGIAEIIIAKNRDGATGTVKLLFDSQFTKFKNLARPVNDDWNA